MYTFYKTQFFKRSRKTTMFTKTILNGFFPNFQKKNKVQLEYQNLNYLKKAY